jgi:hypothetical protein
VAGSTQLGYRPACPARERPAKHLPVARALTHMRRPPLPLHQLRSHVLPVAVLAVLALLLAAGAAAGSPQPSPVCGFCGSQFGDAAADVGVNASVAESHVTVQVHENGSATWRVRNRLERGADPLRDDRSLLTGVARRLTDHAGVAGDTTFVDARMDGDAAVLVYRDADAAERHAGLLVVDYLHHDGYTPWHVVNADSFTLRGPPGTTVASDHGDGSVDGRSVTWTGNASGPIYEATTIEPTLVVFGSDDSTATDVRAAAATTLSVGPLLVERATGFLLVQVPVFVALLALVVGVVARVDPQVPAGVLATVVAVLGLAGTSLVALRVLPLLLAGPPLLAVLLGAAAATGRSHDHLRTARRQALVAAGCLVVVAGGLTGLGALTGRAPSGAWGVVRQTAPALPVAAALPLGAAAARGRPAALRWGLAATVAFAAVPPLVVDFAGAHAGFGAGMMMVAFLIAAVVLPPLSAPLVVLGGRLTDDRPATAGDDVGSQSPGRRLDDV